MLLPSQNKYSRQLKHFICVYFDTGSLEELLEHSHGDLVTCSTCNMFYNVIQSIEENTIDDEDIEVDVEVQDNLGIIIQKASGKRGNKFLTLNYKYNES